MICGDGEKIAGSWKKTRYSVPSATIDSTAVHNNKDRFDFKFPACRSTPSLRSLLSCFSRLNHEGALAGFMFEFIRPRHSPKESIARLLLQLQRQKLVFASNRPFRRVALLAEIPIQNRHCNQQSVSAQWLGISLAPERHLFPSYPVE